MKTERYTTLFVVLVVALLGAVAFHAPAVDARLRFGVWTKITVPAGSASTTAALPGLKSTDAVVGTLNTALTTVTLKSVAPSDGVATVTLTGQPGGTGATVTILVVR